MIHQQNNIADYSFRFQNTFLKLRGGGGAGAGAGPAAAAASANNIFAVGHAQFGPLIEKLTPGKHNADIITAVLLSLLLEPIVKIWYEQLSFLFHNNTNITITERDEHDGRIITTTKRHRPYEKSKLYHVFQTLSSTARLFLLIAAIDILKIFVMCLGVKIPQNSDNITTVFGYGIYMLWGFRRLSVLKLYLLTNIMVNTDIINNPGRLQIINRLTDYALLFFGIFAFYEVWNFEMGYSAKSVVAVFSLGTAVVSLATKDIITNFLNGILLSASDRIYEGDLISIQGNIKKVNRLGWLETALRGEDNVLHTIPNTELLTSQVSNLSRIKTCQVHQTLRFPYSAVDKLPKLSHDIKCEIRSACPSIITDGSRPFQCYWVNFQSNHLEVFVDAHFRIPPVGDAYYENRQRCLQAIDRAIQKNEIASYSGSSG